MEISLFLGKVLGCYFLIAGFAYLTQRRVFAEVTKEMSRNFYLIYIISFFVMILGLLMVFSHNLWVEDWRVLITIIAWVTLIKGIYWIFFSAHAKKSLNWWLDQKVFYYLTGVFILLMGAFLVYHGFAFHL